MIPPEVYSLLRRYHAQFGLPALDADAAREWTRRFAEQCRYSLAALEQASGVEFGHKRADAGRPPSTDALAARTLGGQLLAVDLIINQGVSIQMLAPSTAAVMDITGQVFIPVEPHNWIGDVVEPPAPPTPALPPDDDEEILDLIAQVAGDVEAIEQHLSAIVDVQRATLQLITELTTRARA